MTSEKIAQNVAQTSYFTIFSVKKLAKILRLKYLIWRKFAQSGHPEQQCRRRDLRNHFSILIAPDADCLSVQKIIFRV
jgi:hypothetical protein